MAQNSPIEKLTTAVFGFALAVGALSLTAANPETITDVVEGLVLFSLSFLILVVIWWGTSDIMSKIDQGKPVTIFLNIVLLFFVAIEPYLLNILNASVELFPLSSTLYAIDMAFLMGLSAALCHILIKENNISRSGGIISLCVRVSSSSRYYLSFLNGLWAGCQFGF
jgi:uncharacterized membrane protein